LDNNFVLSFIGILNELAYFIPELL